MLANLPKWTGDASNISGLARTRSASAETGAWESDPAAGAEVAFLDGGATEAEPEAITQPGERLRVYNLAGYGEPLLLSEVLISSKSLAKEAAALAYMRRSPYDVRPSLLLLMQAQVAGEVPAVVRYAKNYLQVWCGRNGVTAGELAIEAAAIDGLAVLYRLRERRDPKVLSPRLATPPSKLSARAFRMRDETYRALRIAAVGVLQRRYLEAVIQFAEALAEWPEVQSRGRGGHRHATLRTTGPSGIREPVPTPLKNWSRATTRKLPRSRIVNKLDAP